MAPVARELAAGGHGVLEPLQISSTVEGQIEELQAVLTKYRSSPFILIGHSWGAWLCFMVAARYPALVKKLLLVASGPFEDKYVAGLHRTRMDRLRAEEQNEFDAILQTLADPMAGNKNLLFSRLYDLVTKADSYELIPLEAEESNLIEKRWDIFQSIWETAAQLRKSGELLALGKHIQCPVIAVHGDYDPHPAAGVEKPLSDVLSDFKFVPLKKCGHCPWMERHARDQFYRIIKEETT
ncbi:MAG: alpha/beta hydrolase [Desulfobulbaceae bacterium]|nr:alpha/beta hydrolase [Desulfobulbaceae bacterium]